MCIRDRHKYTSAKLIDGMNKMHKYWKKLISYIAILTIIVVTSWVLLNTDVQPPEEIQVPETPQSIPPISAEPVAREESSTKGYVYDDKLGFGFEYPDGWAAYFEDGDFPDKTIKKVVSFEKLSKQKLGGSEYL